MKTDCFVILRIDYDATKLRRNGVVVQKVLRNEVAAKAETRRLNEATPALAPYWYEWQKASLVEE